MFWQTSPKIQSLPHAILHVDCDAFFASCEQAIHPEWKGKPVVTGKERGIASAASYPAKKAGVYRGMILSEVKKVCPEAIIVPSDYETYGLFSKRMFEILRRFSSRVEEYGIDEGFVDLTGLRRPLNMSYLKMAREIKKTLQAELGITVTVGLAPTKVLAKIASKWQKPNGFTYISGTDTTQYLKKLPIEYVWGIGRNTANHMHQFGIRTAYDFSNKSFEWVVREFTKPHQEIWKELNAEMVYDVMTEEKTRYASITKTKTFTPPNNDRDFVFSQLMKNLENACIKARRHNLIANSIVVLLKGQDFKTYALEAKLTRASAYPHDLTHIVKPLFEKLFDTAKIYRSTGIVLGKLQENANIQTNLFESPVELHNLQKVYQAVDSLSATFGKHTVHLGATLKANKDRQHRGMRGDESLRKNTKLKGERGRKRLNLPLMFGMVR